MLKCEWSSKYKYKSVWQFAILLLLCFATFSCKEKTDNRKVTRAFYYWRSVLKPSAFEQKLTDTLKIKTLYVKYFDIDWDNERAAPIPTATLRVGEKPSANIEIIPCVFITNECIAKIDSADVSRLSQNILKLVESINEEMNQPNIHELQIDCDWTAGTRKQYFELLNAIRKEMSIFSSTKQAKLSCTIRLHQVKYLTRTGVPPVDRGMLMAYNMGNLKNPATKNSILENKELKKYIGTLPTYPLPLDIALPAFEWTVLYRNNLYAGLIRLNENVFTGINFKSLEANRFRVVNDTIISGYEFQENDLLRVEKSDYKEIISVIESIRGKLPAGDIRLSIYHLDSVTLSKYSLHEMETIFSGFN